MTKLSRTIGDSKFNNSSSTKGLQALPKPKRARCYICYMCSSSQWMHQIEAEAAQQKLLIKRNQPSLWFFWQCLWSPETACCTSCSPPASGCRIFSSLWLRANCCPPPSWWSPPSWAASARDISAFEPFFSLQPGTTNKIIRLTMGKITWLKFLLFKMKKFHR